jgi:uncharacterized membrane protein
MYEASSQKQEPLFDEIRLESRDIKVRTITIDDLKQCLRAGYDDFQARPISIPFQIAFYFLVALTIVLFASGQGMRYLAFPMVAGFNLIGPIIAIGFFAMSRQREQGQPMRWGTAFSFVHSSAFAPILALAIIMMVLFVAWLYVAEMIFFGVFGNNPPETLSGILQVLFNTRSGGSLIVYGNFVGLLFACAALAMSVVAFPLALDKPVTSFTALSVSIRAFAANTYVMLAWGLIVVACLALGALLFLVGLAVALPVLGHATWHLYRRLIEN